ncbi:copper resistance protein CopC [Commensalibacter oyaizuii]|uniref:Copper resistance protein CopC n=1 Tax=Commensalibacter oyaizuii TaxID=3043873 RepID=A0ABT6Q1W2_9PROT|nr:copper resistance protein CopC [Commensalibacter sp. TBRC 16381]MDI2091102.1 copper resistance protein CopC [Commensalibacter sp. TBRC 16381]
MKIVKKFFLIAALLMGAGIYTNAASALGLTSSLPKINQVVHAGNQQIILKYDNEFNPFRSRILLVDASGMPTLIPATTTMDYKEVKATYPLKARKYKLQWEVWTWKGDKSSGEIPFTVQ